MDGLMMRQPLNVSALIRHAARWHGDTAIVSRQADGGLHETCWAEVEARARRLAQALAALGAGRGDRIATLAWNNHRHLELYFALSGMGAVCHTVNPRLFPEQIAYILDHAGDRWLFVEPCFLPLVEKLRLPRGALEGVVVMCDHAAMPDGPADALCYEDLVASVDDGRDWPELDENLASALCYTSGTTGEPKGVLYSHRSTVLHAYAVCLPDGIGLRATDTLCPVVPMFHVNAWGLPYAAALAGCRLALPGPGLDGASLFDLFERTGTTLTAGVPTLWFGLLAHMQHNELMFSALRKLVVGGSAAPESMIRTFQDDYGIKVAHCWGMTETSPLGTAGAFKAKHKNLDFDARLALQKKQGRPVFGIDLRVVGAGGEVLPHDGESAGELQVRGPWVASAYFGRDDDPAFGDGWFATGDVATLDADGYMQISDRAKDVIKSGGEWISSVALENIAVGHPDVAEAAVIAIAHPKWDERPLLLVVKTPEAEIDRETLLAWYQGKVAKWWIPDDVVFVEDLPHTATGKLAKKDLREKYRDHVLPSE